MKKIILSSVAIIIALTVNAQTLNKKMGNPTMEEMNMTECSYDKDADGVVLFENLEVTLFAVGNDLQLKCYIR